MPFFVKIQLIIEIFFNLCYLILRQKLHEIYKIVYVYFLLKKGKIIVFINLENIDILEAAKPIKDNMNLLLSNIKDKLLLIPSVIEVIKSYYPTKTLQAILTKEQKADIANGLLEIMTSKDGKNLLATLRDQKNKKI